MVSKIPWAQKQIFWAFEEAIFQSLWSFCVTKLKPFSKKVRQRVQNNLNQNLVIGSFLLIVLELRWAQKRRFSAFEKSIFQFFPKFWVTKLKLFSEKVTRSVQNYLNQSFIIGSFLENGFEATLSSKTNLMSVWKGHFSIFCKSLSDKVETLF